MNYPYQLLSFSFEVIWQHMSYHLITNPTLSTAVVDSRPVDILSRFEDRIFDYGNISLLFVDPLIITRLAGVGRTMDCIIFRHFDRHGFIEKICENNNAHHHHHNRIKDKIKFMGGHTLPKRRNSLHGAQKEYVLTRVFSMKSV